MWWSWLKSIDRLGRNYEEILEHWPKEGIAAAKAKGVQMGRVPMKIPVTFAPVYDRWKRGGVSGRGTARLLDVAQHTFTK